MSKAHVVETDNFVGDAVEIIAHSAQEAIASRGEFRLSLCGGSTPKPVYAALADRGLNWSKVVITFGDERCVPPADAQSNYRMAREVFLSKVPIPEENILRMQGELAPDDAAAEYEELLHIHAEKAGEPRFRHDLVLLGMGGDGHTASLFPGTAALNETTHDVVANYVGSMSAWRITFTYPLINAARHVCFLVNDRAKRSVLEAVLQGDDQYPSAKIKPVDGMLSWLVGR